MLIALAWFINAQRHVSPETKMVTVGAIYCTRRYFANNYYLSIWYTSENGAEEKQCHFCFEAIEAEELLAMDTHSRCPKVLIVNVLDIGQHRPRSTGQYAVAIAGQYFGTISYVFGAWK